MFADACERNGGISFSVVDTADKNQKQSLLPPKLTSTVRRMGEASSEPRNSLGQQPLLVEGVDFVGRCHPPVSKDKAVSLKWMRAGQMELLLWLPQDKVVPKAVTAPTAPAWHPEPFPDMVFVASFLIKQRGYAK